MALVLVVSSCDEDFLDQEPHNSLSSENFAPELALTGVYASLQGDYTGNAFVHQLGYSPIASSRYDGAQRYNGNIESGEGLDSSTSGFRKFWTGYYLSIFRCNFFLDNIKATDDFDQATVDVFIGEVKFIRAFLYSQLAELYGAVPLHLTSTKTITELKEFDKSSKAEVITHVFKDLDDAIDALPISPLVKGHVSRGAALALKARIQLRENDYTGALATTNTIISFGKYGLTGESETSPGVFIPGAYKSIWAIENEAGPEAIWEIEFVGPLQGEGNALEVYANIRFARGGGFMRMWATKFLVDQYENLDGTPVDLSTPYAFDDARFKGRDLRFDQTVLWPGEVLFTGDVWKPGYILYNRAETKLIINKNTWETLDEDLAGGRWESPINTILIRYADVLLMNAEANIETGGDLNSAISIINRIRGRGGLQPITATSQSELRAAVRKERLIEFAGEGIYMHDIRRWGIANVEMERDVERFDGVVTRQRTFYPKLLEWAIPQTDIDNSNVLKQNPLWE